MRAVMLEHGIDEAPAVRFMLDSHHLAKLDRFIACAQRRARHSGRQFAGVVVEVGLDRPVNVHAADVKSLVLMPASCRPNDATAAMRPRRS
jgi:hypothetical protein